ncbi:MAG: hypothetical protein IKA83_08825 [Paludibacteraceae bacterium]|nr:hypothetical protein [Paludibacteraceae bacterium]
MRRYITILLLLVLFGICSCTTTKTVVLPTEERVIQKDSTIIIYRDSIVNKYLPAEKNNDEAKDTLVIEKYYHTIEYKARQDSAKNQESIQVEVPVEVTPDWCRTLLYIDIGIALLIILWIVYRITKFIYLRR